MLRLLLGDRPDLMASYVMKKAPAGICQSLFLFLLSIKLSARKMTVVILWYPCEDQDYRTNMMARLLLWHC